MWRLGLLSFCVASVKRGGVGGACVPAVVRLVVARSPAPCARLCLYHSILRPDCNGTSPIASAVLLCPSGPERTTRSAKPAASTVRFAMLTMAYKCWV